MYSDFILVLTIVVMMIVLVKLLCFVSLNLFFLFGIIQQKKKKTFVWCVYIVLLNT